MAGAVVGALRFTLGADTAEFEKAMKGVEGAMKRAAAIGSAVGTVLGDAFTSAFRSLTESVKQALEAADRMSELAEMIGISTEKLSGLKLAADLNGVSLEALTTNMAKLGKAMAESVNEPAGTAARTLAAMGISATDASGQLRPINDVFLDIAQRFQGYEDGAAKATLAMNLFGRAGAAMIPVLNMGKDGLAQMGDEARRLGLVVESETAKKAAAFNDTLTKLNRAWDGLIIQISARLLPTLQQVADWFVKLTTDSSSMKLALDGVDIAIKSIITSGVIVKTVFEALAAPIAAVIAALILVSQLQFGAAFDALKQGATDFTGEVRKSIQALKDLWTEAAQAPAALAPLATEMPRVAAPLVASANAVRDALREWKDEQRAILDDLLAGAAPYIEKINAINAALAQRIINERTQGQLLRKTEQENRNAITSTATLLGSTLTTVFKKSKGAAIAQAIISTAVGISNAMAGPPTGPPWPYNLAQAALIAASGAAQLASIRSTNESGGGAVPTVSGGGGGGEASDPATPTQMLTLNLAPGRYTRDEVVGLIEQINEAQADGVRLITSVNR
jgi:hypothetical protein